MTDYTALKVGDKMTQLSAYSYQPHAIHTVARLTKTKIVLSNNSEWDREGHIYGSRSDRRYMGGAKIREVRAGDAEYIEAAALRNEIARAVEAGRLNTCDIDRLRQIKNLLPKINKNG